MYADRSLVAACFRHAGGLQRLRSLGVFWTGGFALVALISFIFLESDLRFQESRSSDMSIIG